MTTDSVAASSTEPRHRIPGRRRALQSQLLSGFAVAVTLPMVALAVTGGYSYVQNQRAAATERLQGAARAVRSQVSAHLNAHVQALASLAGAIQESGHLGTATLNRWLARSHATNPGFLTLFIADREGNLVAAHPLMDAQGGPMLGAGHNVADREDFRRALASEHAYVSDAFPGRGFGEDPLVAISVPVADRGGRVRGIVEGSMNLKRCRRFLWDPRALEGATVLVLDRSARVVYSSADWKALDPLDASSRDGAALSSGEGFRCDRLVEQRRQAGFTGVCEPAENGWTVFLEQPNDVILRGAAQYLWIMVGLFAAGIALAVGLAQLFARPVTGPLERLARSVRHYEPGTARRGAAIAARSPVEVADLVHGFEEWVTQAEERTRLLERARQDQERDIAQRVRAEDEAARLHERLAHVSRVASMGDMAAGIAHEINQPLTAIAAYAMACARLIRTGGLRQDKVFETLNYIGEEALRAGGIIHGVRAMVRSQPSQRTRCDVNRLISDAARLARVDQRLEGLELRLELTEPLSPVLADGVQIQQVLLNLIVNGAEATERGNGAAAEIVVRTGEDESAVCVSVSDRGTGLSPAVEKELFRPFFTTKGSGMGMGLSISRTIVEFHGGRLWFTPTEPRGTTFHFALPRA